MEKKRVNGIIVIIIAVVIIIGILFYSSSVRFAPREDIDRKITKGVNSLFLPLMPHSSSEEKPIQIGWVVKLLEADGKLIKSPAEIYAEESKKLGVKRIINPEDKIRVQNKVKQQKSKIKQRENIVVEAISEKVPGFEPFYSFNSIAAFEILGTQIIDPTVLDDLKARDDVEVEAWFSSIPYLHESIPLIDAIDVWQTDANGNECVGAQYSPPRKEVLDVEISVECDEGINSLEEIIAGKNPDENDILNIEFCSSDEIASSSGELTGDNMPVFDL